MTFKTITPKDLHRHMKLGHHVVLLDIRPAEDYENKHIQGARSFPLKSFNAQDIIQTIGASYPTPPTIYVTCASGADAEKACQHLANAGYEYMVCLEGGMQGWTENDLPTETDRTSLAPLKALSVNQQVQIFLGGIVAMGTLMGTLLNAVFLVIPLLAGAGFVYEGAFGTDHLRQFLSKRSWNQ